MYISGWILIPLLTDLYLLFFSQYTDFHYYTLVTYSSDWTFAKSRSILHNPFRVNFVKPVINKGLSSQNKLLFLCKHKIIHFITNGNLITENLMSSLENVNMRKICQMNIVVWRSSYLSVTFRFYFYCNLSTKNFSKTWMKF